MQPFTVPEAEEIAKLKGDFHLSIHLQEKQGLKVISAWRYAVSLSCQAEVHSSVWETACRLSLHAWSVATVGDPGPCFPSSPVRTSPGQPGDVCRAG